jgi:predicted nucleic acid-binding protein
MLVVDTCVLIDIADDDPQFGAASAECLARRLDSGLVISPITYVELAPAFDGSARLLDEFLAGIGVDETAGWTNQDRDAAFAAWARHVSDRRARRSPRRPVADVLIGALAMRCEALITRNGPDFRPLYPRIRVVDPLRDKG